MTMQRPQVGQLINNKYRIARVIGDGGMGSVYEAQHEVLGSKVALKFLHPELARRQGLVQRFLQEARVSAKIQSVHVVRVSDVEQTPEGLPFIVMELLSGQSLQSLYEDLYQRGQRLSYADALDYAVQILDGLEAAHEEGVVHRDLKPDNVMITKGKRGEALVKLLDFGIAKLKINGELYKGLTRPGVLMGTPEYMAPEQVFSADAVDGRADIFSCGVMIFEMLAGRRPVGGDEPHQIAAQYIGGNVARLAELAPHVPAELAAAVHRAMEAEPKNRFSSVQELRAALEPFALAARGGAGATPPGTTPSPRAAMSPDVGPSPVAAVSPAPGGDSGLDRRSVPKTLPPVDDGVDGGATEKVSEPYRGSDPSRGSATSMGGPIDPSFGATAEAAPFFPGATEAYQPMVGGVAPVAPERAGGTAVGAAVLLPDTAGYAVGPVAPAPAAMPGAYGAPSYLSGQPAPKAPTKKGLGLGGILLAGLAVAGLAVGGLFAYDQMSRNDGKSRKDKEPAPIALPTPKDTAPEQTAPEPTDTVVSPPTPTPVPTPPPAVTSPRPQPTSTQPKPQPTATNTIPPLIIPSTLPPIEFPPGIPGWGPQTTPTPTSTTPPAPTTTSTSPGRPRIPPLGRLPRPSTESTAQAPAPPATATSTPPKRTPVEIGKKAQRLPSRIPRTPSSATPRDADAAPSGSVEPTRRLPRPIRAGQYD
jgi:serine/threonine-protein kinase